MQVETAAIEGGYDDLLDAAEDIGGILEAKASNELDLTPLVERWLVAQLEEIEVALAGRRPAEGRVASMVNQVYEPAEPARSIVTRSIAKGA